jgi:hypothetical protein
VPLIAMLDGARVDASAHTAESWAELKQSDDAKRMVMPLCEIRAIAKARGTTLFFSHHRIADCKVEHGGETPQHLAMKEALKACIDEVVGWHAIVEHPHPSREWIIDVLAESDDRRNRVAFEVQLSSQTPENYFARSQRYFDSGVFPVWLVPRQLEYNPTKVPVVVTGFGKSSTIPEDKTKLLNLPADQDLVKAKDNLGAFVTALLTRGPSWEVGSPADQAARQKAEAAREAALVEAERRKQEAFEQSIAEMNDRSASPESAFGSHIVRTESDAFVWGSLTQCWSCEEPVLVWDARSPGFRKRWARIPRPAVKSEVGEKRYENHPEVHRAIDQWIRAAKSDIPKALIKPRRTKASGRLYSAFVCPECDSTIGQYFISCIRPEKWSVLSGPDVKTQSKAPALKAKTPAGRPITIAPQIDAQSSRPRQVSPPLEAASTVTPPRCLLHSNPWPTCGWCNRFPVSGQP